MNDFKEWLSDNLRYFIVGAVVILIIGGSIVGLRIYSTAVNPKDKNDVIVETDPKALQTEEKTTQGKDTEKETAGQEKSTDQQQETNFVVKNPQETETREPVETEPPETELRETEPPETEAPQTEPPETEPVETEPPEPVYLTINSACYMRSYPDYGDNIIGEYSAGTTVQFLEDVGGWYKVSVNGVVGYMGARFFN